MIRSLKRFFSRRRADAPPTIDQLVRLGYEPHIAQIIHRSQPYSMTSPARLAALCDAVEYVTARNLPGDFVECGVWQGGSMMAVAQALLRLGVSDRRLYLYDTYAGMTTPGEYDASCDGISAWRQMQEAMALSPTGAWCDSPLDVVERNLRSTGYPFHNLRFVVGKVEDTIPGEAPDQIALLRLDTDWYESTRHELEHLFPRLSPGGVLIVDDYGHWQGARRAVDEYLQKWGAPLLLSRIDYTGRIAVLPETLARRAA